VSFTRPLAVTFPGHADSSFVSARLFPGSCLSASRDSCSPTSASGVVRQNSSRDPRRGGSWWSRQAVIGSIEQEDSGGGQPACAWSAHIYKGPVENRSGLGRSIMMVQPSESLL